MPWAMWVLIGVLGISGDAVRLDGTQATGEVQSLSAQSLELVTSAGPVSVPVADLQTLRLKGASSSADPLEVSLVEGSAIAATGIAVAEGKLKFSGGPLDGQSLATERVHAIRLAPGKNGLLPIWQEMREKVSPSDLLIIHKGETLDFVAGTIGTIDDMSVALIARGREVKVAREKVFGIVYATHQRASGSPLCELELTNGSRIRAQSVLFNTTQATITTTFSAEIVVPLDSLQSIDFALGRITPLIKTLTRETYPYEKDFLKVRSHQILTSSGKKAPMKLGGKPYAEGLVVHPETKLEFTLNRQYRRLRTLVGIDETNADRANFQPVVHLQLLADGKSVFDQDIRWDQAPIPVDIDLTDVRRLELVTKSQDGKTGPSRLVDLADAKLIK